LEGAKSMRRRIGAYWEAAVVLKDHLPEEEPAKAPPKKTRAQTPSRRRSAAVQTS